jgi:hypothetical protein
MPRVPGVLWPMALSAAIIRVLEKRFPGFKSDVRRSLEDSARRMEESGDPDIVADAPSVHELVASWVFKEGGSSPGDSAQR